VADPHRLDLQWYPFRGAYYAAPVTASLAAKLGADGLSGRDVGDSGASSG
jgi:hypothetical protein